MYIYKQLTRHNQKAFERLAKGYWAFGTFSPKEEAVANLFFIHPNDDNLLATIEALGLPDISKLYFSITFYFRVYPKRSDYWPIRRIAIYDRPHTELNRGAKIKPLAILNYSPAEWLDGKMRIWSSKLRDELKMITGKTLEVNKMHLYRIKLDKIQSVFK